MDIRKILANLPHRFPFLMLDRVLEFDPPQSIKAVKNVTVNEPFFTGHFPDNPVMPGVLLLESMAQAAAVLASISEEVVSDESTMHYLAGIDDARFKRVVTPGDQVIIDIEILRRKRDIWKYSGTATVDGELVCTANILSAVKKDTV